MGDAAADTHLRLPDDARALVNYTLAMGCKLYSQLRALDLRRYELLSAERAVEEALTGGFAQVRHWAAQVCRLLANLPDAMGAPPEDTAAALNEDLDLDFDLTPKTDPRQLLVGGAAPLEEIEQALGRLTQGAPHEKVSLKDLRATCSMLIDELSRARERLEAARWQRTKPALLTEANEARRTAEKALRTALLAVASAVDSPSARRFLAEESAELSEALCVRDLLFGLRRDLGNLTAQASELSPEAVRDRMSRASDCLRALSYSPLFPQLRFVDRYPLQQFQQRLDHWLHDARGQLDQARQILSDLGTFAQLLAQINHREVLVQHDRQLARFCLDNLRDLRATLDFAKEHAWPRLKVVLEELGRLRWRDQDLYTFVEAERERGGSPGEDLSKRIDALIARVESVR